jgi:hypothetical protein
MVDAALKAWKKPFPPKRPQPDQSAGRVGLSVVNLEDPAILIT